jgi:threonine/homoserine/homoserine lactone efflux protein
MSRNDEMSPEAKWGVGCLVGAAAMVGFVILLMYVAFTFDLPEWAQIALGVGLTIGGGLLSWLVVTALSQNRQRTDGPAVNAVPDQPPARENGPE